MGRDFLASDKETNEYMASEIDGFEDDEVDFPEGLFEDQPSIDEASLIESMADDFCAFDEIPQGITPKSKRIEAHVGLERKILAHLKKGELSEIKAIFPNNPAKKSSVSNSGKALAANPALIAYAFLAEVLVIKDSKLRVKKGGLAKASQFMKSHKNAKKIKSVVSTLSGSPIASLLTSVMLKEGKITLKKGKEESLRQTRRKSKEASDYNPFSSYADDDMLDLDFQSGLDLGDDFGVVQDTFRRDYDPNYENLEKEPEEDAEKGILDGISMADYSNKAIADFFAGENINAKDAAKKLANEPGFNRSRINQIVGILGNMSLTKALEDHSNAKAENEKAMSVWQ